MENPLGILYKKHDTFSDQYGDSIWLLILIILCLLLIMAYCYIMSHMDLIKSDWVNQRCKPYVMPFAGMINLPKDKTMFQFTSENFTYCTQGILQSTTSSALSPLTFITSALAETFSAISDAINSARAMMSKLRTFFQTMAQELMGRIMNVMISLQQIIISVRDFLAKVQGILTGTLFTSLGTYYTLKALLGAIAELILKILIALAAIIAILWVFPVTWGAAVTNTAIFVALSIPLALMLTFFTEVLKIHPSLAIPSVKCFDAETLIKENTPAAEICPGDWLAPDIRVTAKQTFVKDDDMDMYLLGGVCVSGTHLVYYPPRNSWIAVECHPDAMPLITKYKNKYKNKEKKERIYCFCTTSGTIPLMNNTLLFADWDDDEKKEENYLPTKKHPGFRPETTVCLITNEEVPIRSIDIGDILEDGAKVYGLVEIEFGLFHLFTTTGTFKANGKQVLDYNGSL